MEDRNLSPQPFRGRSSDDPETFLRQFVHCCQYKEYTEPKKFTFFKLLLLDSAADWLDQQPLAVSGDFDRLRQAFEERYKTPDIWKHIAAKEIFNRRQKADENVEGYIVSMRKLAKMIAADDKITSYAILDGLKPHISMYVTQQKPETIQQILEAAKIAEITTLATGNR